MDIRELFEHGFTPLGLSACIAVVFNKPRYLLDAMTDFDAKRVNGNDLQLMTICRTTGATERRVGTFQPSPSTAFATWYHQLTEADLELFDHARDHGVRLPAPSTGFPTRSQLDQLRMQLETHMITAEATELLHSARHIDCRRYGASPEDFEAARAIGMAIAQQMQVAANVTLAKTSRDNCWTYIQRLEHMMSGAAGTFVKDTTSISLTSFHPQGDQLTLRQNTYATKVLAAMGAADAVIPVGALLVFMPQRGDVYGHFAIFVGDGKCVGYNHPTGDTVKELPLSALSRPYPKVGVVVPTEWA